MSTDLPPSPASWLKRMLPRGLYGRAALILILPVVALQLVVSLSFIQRHFEGVTRQMTSSIADEIALVVAVQAQSPSDADAVARALGLQIILPPPELAPGTGRVFWDLSGRVVAEVLAEQLPMLEGLSLAVPNQVTVRLAGEDGDFGITFTRRLVSAANPHQLLVLMVIFGGVMTFIAYLFLRNQLRPIERLADAAEHYGRGRIVSYRPTGAREVRAAGAAFLQMRERIEEQNQSRSVMLSGVGHDLRTPLTRLRLGLEMMGDDDALELRADVEEMEHMVTAFLDFVRDDNEAPLQECDVPALVDKVAEDAGRMGSVVTVLPARGQVMPVRLRPMAIRRAIENLVANALRHGAKVQIGVTFTADALHIAVADDGPGIAPDSRESAMQPFVRLDGARNQDRGAGVGLGLAIVAGITRAHGGALRLGQSYELGGLLAEIVLPR